MATPLPVSKTGSSSSQPAGSSLALMRSKEAARSALAVRQAEKSFSQAALASRPRSPRPRVWARTSSATAKLCSGSKPSTRLVAATSSLPRAEPWEASVPWACGAYQAMIERAAMNEGRSVSALAAWKAANSAFGSRSPLACGATRWTCQPYAS